MNYVFNIQGFWGFGVLGFLGSNPGLGFRGPVCGEVRGWADARPSSNPHSAATRRTRSGAVARSACRRTFSGDGEAGVDVENPASRPTRPPSAPRQAQGHPSGALIALASCSPGRNPQALRGGLPSARGWLDVPSQKGSFQGGPRYRDVPAFIRRRCSPRAAGPMVRGAASALKKVARDLQSNLDHSGPHSGGSTGHGSPAKGRRGPRGPRSYSSGSDTEDPRGPGSSPVR